MLREKFELPVVPGKSVEMPQHVRIGIGGDSPALDAALIRLASALDDYAVAGQTPQDE